MSAIERKNSRTETKAENALTLISLIGGVIFLVAFTFSFNFPSVLTGPVRKLTEAIQEISRKNYKYRIHIKNKDEFVKWPMHLMQWLSVLNILQQQSE
jgi:nitrogen fixation/metabolism regulation signal transduction histidine kinase